MTIKELKNLMKDLPDDFVVVSSWDSAYSNIDAIYLHRGAGIVVFDVDTFTPASGKEVDQVDWMDMGEVTNGWEKLHEHED